MTAPRLRGMKAKGEKIVFVTAYDFTSGSIADAAGVDAILVGDSVGNVLLGYNSTLPVTLADMVYHVSACSRGVNHALLVGDLPFGSYQSGISSAVDSSVALMRAGAEAVKLEGDYHEEIRAIVKAGIPVMGHLGFTPQSVNAFGGHKVQGREGSAAYVDSALRLQDAGAFSIVLELMPSAVAVEVTAALDIPTIGIGAGVGCDGQVQVFHDVLGLGERTFRHATAFVDGRRLFVDGLSTFAAKVRSGTFPTEENSF